jgi:hypothetical protein
VNNRRAAENAKQTQRIFFCEEKKSLRFLSALCGSAVIPNLNLFFYTQITSRIGFWQRESSRD